MTWIPAKSNYFPFDPTYRQSGRLDRNKSFTSLKYPLKLVAILLPSDIVVVCRAPRSHAAGPSAALPLSILTLVTRESSAQRLRDSTSIDGLGRLLSLKVVDYVINHPKVDPLKRPERLIDLAFAIDFDQHLVLARSALGSRI